MNGRRTQVLAMWDIQWIIDDDGYDDRVLFLTYIQCEPNQQLTLTAYEAAVSDSFLSFSLELYTKHVHDELNDSPTWGDVKFTTVTNEGSNEWPSIQTSREQNHSMCGADMCLVPGTTHVEGFCCVEPKKTAVDFIN